MNKKVLIINTGGTLSSVAKEHGLTPGLTTDSMLRELHVVAGEAELITQEFSSLDSAKYFSGGLGAACTGHQPAAG